MAYTETEVKAFAEKDLRISKLAIVKSLIEKLDLEDVYEVGKVTKLAEKYIDYVYEERKETTKRGQVGRVADTEPKWGQLAEGLNLAIPNAENIKILNQVISEYKKAHKASANPADILTHILNTFGRYPAKTESVKKVIQSFIER